MNEDVNKFVEALVAQDSLAGQNPLLTEDTIAQMKMMSSVDDVQAFAIATVKMDVQKVNNALIDAGLEFGAGGVDDFDIAGLFGFGADALPGIIGGLPSSYTPRNPADTDFYREGDEYNIFANLPVEDLYSLQARLIQGGLLARGGFTVL
jgi:hypothetical protein